MKQGMRTLSGISLWSAEITMFEHTRTAVAASPMPRPVSTEVEVASVGQVPMTSTRTGFSLIKPLVRMLNFDFF